MKKLTCEMCGSTDIIKQDGVFVCQVCGCKYSVEEAKKMMIEGTVEVTGTVKVDNTDAINNYLNMARNATQSRNYAEAEGYCNRIIEIDSLNWEAWYLKGEAAGWQSTLANVRIQEAINAFANAMRFCPEEQRDTLAGLCKDDIKSLQVAVLSLRMNNFNTHPDKSDLNNFKQTVNMIQTTSSSFTTQTLIPIGAHEAGICMLAILNGVTEAYNIVWRDYQGSEYLPTNYEWDRFISEGNTLVSALEYSLILGEKFTDDVNLNNVKIGVYEQMIKMQAAVRDSCCYEVRFYNGRKSCVKSGILNSQAHRDLDDMIAQWNYEIAKLQNLNKQLQETAAREAAEEQRIAEEAAKNRADEYWAAHPYEKASLNAEKDILKKQKEPLSVLITELKNEENSPVAASVELRKLKDKIEALWQELRKQGLFNGKRKKEIKAQIDEINHKVEVVKAEAEKQKVERDAKLKERLEPLEKNLSDVNQRLFEITAKLCNPTNAPQPEAVPSQCIPSEFTAPSATPNAEVQALEIKYDVILISTGSLKMSVIKAVKDHTGLDLAAAKNLVENVPSMVKEHVSRAEAEDIKQCLEAVGARVELR